MWSVMSVTMNIMIILIQVTPVMLMRISKELGQEDSSRSVRVLHLVHSLEIDIYEPDAEGKVRLQKCLISKYLLKVRMKSEIKVLVFNLTQ